MCPHLNESKDFYSQMSSEAERSSPALKSLKNPCKKMLKHPKKKEETNESWNHHVRTWCRMPCCEAVVCDIKRHLRVHIKRGELDTNDVDGHAEIMRHGNLTSLQLFITYITGWKCDLNLMPPLSPDLKFILLLMRIFRMRIFKIYAPANLIWRVPESSKRQKRAPNSASGCSPLPGTICCAT